MNIRPGQGFERTISGVRGPRPVYGLVLAVDEQYVTYAPVIDSNECGVCRRSYDERGASYQTDKDNVRLNDCPPPFSEIGSVHFREGDSKSKVMAMADMRHLSSVSLCDFMETCQIVDNGARISEKDFGRVLHHPWPRQMEQEKVMSPEEAARMKRRLESLDSLSISTDGLYEDLDYGR